MRHVTFITGIDTQHGSYETCNLDVSWQSVFFFFFLFSIFFMWNR